MPGNIFFDNFDDRLNFDSRSLIFESAITKTLTKDVRLRFSVIHRLIYEKVARKSQLKLSYPARRPFCSFIRTVGPVPNLLGIDWFQSQLIVLLIIVILEGLITHVLIDRSIKLLSNLDKALEFIMSF